MVNLVNRTSGILRVLAALAAVGVSLVAAAPDAVAQGESKLTISTLGTHAGPVPAGDRSEPANLLSFGDQRILVDAGDGAAVQLGKIGVNLGQVQTVMLSHLHFDHTGGLFAVLSLRFMVGYPQPLTVYGPPGTRDLVDRLTAAVEAGRSFLPASAHGAPVSVVELVDKSEVKIGGVRIVAAENSHYVTVPAPRPVSLAYRFEAGGRSIVYTGDTGPSVAVERLCRGSDLLVSEIFDADIAMEGFRHGRPNASAVELAAVESHFRHQHLSPDDVGLMAKRCGAKSLVLTHNSLPQDRIPSATVEIARRYNGEIRFAKDLDVF